MERRKYFPFVFLVYIILSVSLPIQVEAGTLPATTVRLAIDSFPTPGHPTQQYRLVFSVWLRNISGGPLYFAGGQLYFYINGNILNGGTGTVTIKESNGITPRNPQVIANANPMLYEIRAGGNLPPGWTDPYPYTIANSDSIRWVSFTLVSSNPMSSVNPGITFNTSPSKTTLSAYINATNTSIVSAATFMNYTLPYLSAQLSTFNGNAQGRDGILNWKTTQEQNFSHFILERAKISDNKTEIPYTAISTLKPKSQANGVASYSFIDKQLHVGKYSYRLKMVDYDGTCKYSPNEVFITIQAPTTFGISQNYPNPFNPSTTIEYQLPENSHVQIELFSVKGEKIATLLDAQQEADYHKLVISQSNLGKNLASGIYIYRIIAKGNSQHSFTSTKKLMLLK
ncbi:MAG: T9SS type A sorting domain-containing protein [Ignavibacteria bacterium]|nr:T9SS type A sorting domain-containing protein [Ignavibacteria bacterium]